MSERTTRTLVLRGGGATGLACAASLWLSPTAWLGVLAGGLWNLANLWCLARALKTWLSPTSSRWRTVFWFLVKFPGLYLVAIGLLQLPWVSLVGFGSGFVVVLLAAIMVYGG